MTVYFLITPNIDIYFKCYSSLFYKCIIRIIDSWDFGVFRSNWNLNECTIPCIISLCELIMLTCFWVNLDIWKRRQIVWALASNHLHVLYIQLWVCVKRHATVVNKNSITSRIVKIRSPSLNHMSMISPPLIWKLLRANN